MNFINLPRGRRLVPVPAATAKFDSLSAAYHSQLDVTAAEVPFEGGDLSLILILPGKQSEFIAGGLGRMEGKLDVEAWNSLMKSFQPLKADLKLPMFRHRSPIELKDTFVQMGVSSAFDKQSADFSGVNGGRDLFLTSFQQLTEFAVDGRDVELIETKKRSARSRSRRSPWSLFGTSSRRRKRKNRQQDEDHHHHHHHPHPDPGHGDGSDDEPEYRLHFNRQFLYVLRHNPTGLVLFIGRYYQPEGHGNQHGHHHEGHGHHHEH